jgi:hypothetical protein
MATQTISALDKTDRVVESGRWTDRRALALWILGSAVSWSLVLGLAYLGRALF